MSVRSAPARRSRPSTRSSSPAPTWASPRASSWRSRPDSTLSRSSARSAGARQSWVLANRSGRMLDNDYPLGFKVALHRKDLGIAPRPGGQLGAVLPVSALAAQLETGLVAGGHGDDDMSAVAAPSAPCRRSSPDQAGCRGRCGRVAPSSTSTHCRVRERERSANARRRRPGATWLVETDEQHGIAQPAVVARPEAVGVVHRRDVDPARPERRIGQAVWAYLPSWIAIIRPVTPPSMRSIAMLANVVATIWSSESGSPLRRS